MIKDSLIFLSVPGCSTFQYSVKSGKNKENFCHAIQEEKEKLLYCLNEKAFTAPILLGELGICYQQKLCIFHY